MEYEIDDDPQGPPDSPETRRDGGLRERLDYRREPRGRRHAHTEREPLEQLGEPA